MNKLTRLMALLLALMMIFSSFATADTVTAYSPEDMTAEMWQQLVNDAKNSLFTVTPGGEVLPLDTTTPEENPYAPYDMIYEVPLSAGAKTMSSASKLVITSDVAGQWQINITGDVWANLSNETGATLGVDYVMLQNVLVDAKASLRQVDAEGNVIGTMVVTIDDTLVVGKVSTVARDTTETTDTTDTTDDGALSLQDANEGNTIVVEVKYLIAQTTQQVANSYSAQIAVNSPLETELTLPRTAGYLATSYAVSPGEQSEVVANFVAQTATADGSIALNVTKELAYQSYTITVYYEPTNVEFTVYHYQQNANDDGYTLVEADTQVIATKKTGEAVGTGLEKKDYTGFEPLWYDSTAKVAADGSTEVEIYYNREYFLMNFDLGEGGYGVDPIYARFGAPISVGTPSRPGYTFLGWSSTEPAEQTDPKVAPEYTAVTLPTTMPAENSLYYAAWDMNDTATVSVVFWGENPNDEGYSYLQAGAVDVATGTEYTFSDGTTVFMICGKDEHTHTEECGPTCGKEEHITHTDACLANCTHPKHELSCYQTRNNYTLQETTPGQTLNATVDGVYSYTTSSGYNQQTHNYLYLDGIWYCYYDNHSGNKSDTQEISLDCDHTHTDACYSCEYHEHTAACYSCGLEEHTHDDSCNQTGSGLDSTLWKFVRSETVTVAADGSSVINVYYDRKEFTLTFHYDYDENSNSYNSTSTITDKWGANILTKYNAITTAANGFMWSESTTGGPYTNYFGVMPAENKTYYLHSDSGSVKNSMIYYLQDIQSAGAEKTYTQKFETVWYSSPGIMSYGYYSVTEEDFFAFEGFTVNEELSANVGDATKEAKFYYDRHNYAIEYYSPYTLLKKTTGVPYQSPLSGYDWSPDASMAPSQYEPGSVAFAGWYLNPECTGEQFIFTSTDPVHTMPAGTNDGDTTLTVYAKWELVKHTVNYYLNKTMTADELLYTQQVTHGEFAPAVKDPENGGYTFDGWYYLDENGNEVRFDCDYLSIRRDLNVYAKWSSDTPVAFTFHFEDTDGNKLADDYVGQALPNQTVTMDAYVGSQLNLVPAGVDPLIYFPNVSSHSIVIDFDPDNNEFTFVYTKGQTIPYTVQYIEATVVDGVWTPVVDAEGNYNHLATEKKAETEKAIVTENYVPVMGYMPQVTQIRMIVSTDGENIIQFLYKADTVNALYNVSHYLVDHNGTETLYREVLNNPGVIGQTYSETWLTNIPGYEFSYAKVVETTWVDEAWVTNTVDPDAVDEENHTVSNTLPAGGMHIKLYYEPIQYPYIVYHVDEDGKELHTPDERTAAYGSTIAASDFVKTIANYEVVSMVPTSCDIQIEELEEGQKPEKNVITITYKLKVSTLTIKKVVESAVEGVTAPENDKFTIQVTLKDANGTPVANTTFPVTGLTGVTEVTTDTNGVATFDNVGAGTVITISNVVIGTAYTVEEIYVAEYYTVTYADDAEEATIQPTGNTVTVTNTYQTGDLTITKNVVNETIYDVSDQEFTFNVTLTHDKNDLLPASISYKVGTDERTATLESGVCTIKLKAGQTAEIANLPYGTTYKVEEVAVDGYVTTYENAEGKINADNPEMTAKITNEYKVGTLTITKTINGAQSNTDDTFLFMVTGGNGVSLQVLVHAGESVTIEQLPVGTYTVTEIETWSWRYDCTDTDATMTATITLNNLDVSVEFENEVIHNYWLDGADYEMNQFTVTTENVTE